MFTPHFSERSFLSIHDHLPKRAGPGRAWLWLETKPHAPFQAAPLPCSDANLPVRQYFPPKALRKRKKPKNSRSFWTSVPQINQHTPLHAVLFLLNLSYQPVTALSICYPKRFCCIRACIFHRKTFSASSSEKYPLARTVAFITISGNSTLFCSSFRR